MQSIRIAAYAAAMSLGLSFATPFAYADDEATMQTCLNVGDKLISALDAQQQNANYHDAMKERRFGQSLCLNGYYDKGVAHYRRGLLLLDPPQPPKG